MIIGLTGPIGSGKSQVAAIWRERGLHVIDCDAVYRALLASSKTLQNAILTAFSEAETNGKIDRKKVLECLEIKNEKIAAKILVKIEINEKQKSIYDVIALNFNDKYSSDLHIDMDLVSHRVDSITFIKTIIALENQFEFEFDDEMLIYAAFPSIRDMVEYVEKKIS